MNESVAANEFHYVGSELELFARALRWKAYWSQKLRPYIKGDALEVGAGIGSNTSFLRQYSSGRWVCLEPDPEMLVLLEKKISAEGKLGSVESVCGTMQDLTAEERFDTILYIDVLEHIEDDTGELRMAAARLRPGGRIIVLSPAHQFLFTPFDSEIGHFRRYNRPLLRKASPPGLDMEKLIYLDSCGIALSAANRVLLRQAIPTEAQILVWDKWVIPISRVLDPIFSYKLGKSIVGVWRKLEVNSVNA